MLAHTLQAALINKTHNFIAPFLRIFFQAKILHHPSFSPALMGLQPKFLIILKFFKKSFLENKVPQKKKKSYQIPFFFKPITALLLLKTWVWSHDLGCLCPSTEARYFFQHNSSLFFSLPPIVFEKKSFFFFFLTMFFIVEKNVFFQQWKTDFFFFFLSLP